jgi:hypothetical protein
MRHVAFRKLIPLAVLRHTHDADGFRVHTLRAMWREFGEELSRQFPAQEEAKRFDDEQWAIQLYVGTPEEYIAMRDDIRGAAYRAGFKAGKDSMREQVRKRALYRVENLLADKVVG